MVNSVITNILTQNGRALVKADSSSHLSGFFREAKLIRKRNFVCSVCSYLPTELCLFFLTTWPLASMFSYPLQRRI